METGIMVLGGIYAHQVLRMDRLPKADETVAGRDPRMVLGGGGAVQACAMARLRGEVSLLGQVGCDETGRWVAGQLEQAGVDISLLTRPPTGITGQKLVLLSEQEQAHTILVSGLNSHYPPERLETLRPAIAKARYLLLTLEVPMPVVESAAQWAKESGAVVILNPTPPQPLSPQLLACLDYLTPTEEELACLTDAPLDDFSRAMASLKAGELRAQGVKKVLVKMSGKGVLLVGDRHEHLWRGTSTGAMSFAKTGDLFNAAFALALARNQNELAAGRYALAALSSAIQVPGEPAFLPQGTALDHVIRRMRQRQIRELDTLHKAVPLRRSPNHHGESGPTGGT